MTYEEVGTGRPLLVVDGWGYSGRLTMMMHAPVLDGRPGWRCLYPELPGHGKTPLPDWLQTPDDLLDVLLEFMEVVAPGERSENLSGVPDRRDPSVSPLYADMSGFPPLLIHVSGDELILDDSVRVAERARAAGANVTLRVFPGLWHVFHLMANLPESRTAVKEIGEFVRERLANPRSRAVTPV
jgi:acetyl esterase/lipase